MIPVYHKKVKQVSEDKLDSEVKHPSNYLRN
jgi:hypothetical protein